MIDKAILDRVIRKHIPGLIELAQRCGTDSPLLLAAVRFNRAIIARLYHEEVAKWRG